MYNFDKYYYNSINGTFSMTYSVVAYFLTFISATDIGVSEYRNYELVSPHPIIECTAVLEEYEHTHERRIVHICKTERLYRYITDIDTVEIVTEGVYAI